MSQLHNIDQKFYLLQKNFFFLETILRISKEKKYEDKC
jgi:hypothetical protein